MKRNVMKSSFGSCFLDFHTYTRNFNFFDFLNFLLDSSIRFSYSIKKCIKLYDLKPQSLPVFIGFYTISCVYRCNIICAGMWSHDVNKVSMMIYTVGFYAKIRVLGMQCNAKIACNLPIVAVLLKSSSFTKDFQHFWTRLNRNLLIKSYHFSLRNVSVI